MKKLQIVIFVLFFASISYPQSGWYPVHMLGSEYIIRSLQFTSVNTGYAVAQNTSSGPSQFLKTTNGGYNWQSIPFPYRFCGASNFVDNNTGFVIGANSNNTVYCTIFKTTDGGINWVIKDSMYALYIIKFYDHNTGFIAADFGNTYKTTNCGENWTFYHMVSDFYTPYDLCCLDADNWLITFHTDNNLLKKTTNGGINWNVLDLGGPGGIYLQSLSFINSTTGYNAYFYGEIYKTTNKGVDWTPIDTIASFNAVSLNFVDENTGYLLGRSSTGGICKTTDGGYNWTRQMTNPNVLLYSSYFFNSYSGFVSGENGTIFKTTNGGSVFVNNTSSEIPSTYSLSQNYPNPFNPSTTIKFSIPENGKLKNGIVILKVYDILGNEVATLVNESLKPGTYETTFDGSMLPSGVYFYKICAGDFSETKKMLMIK
jgi:photosystem II stability/assembly factor-like uncharacterized protein